MELDLFSEWQKIRNESWQKQEAFVCFLINQLYISRQTLQFFAEDKYVGPSGFKHVDGTVSSHVAIVLADFNSKLEKAIS